MEGPHQKRTQTVDLFLFIQAMVCYLCVNRGLEKGKGGEVKQTVARASCQNAATAALSSSSFPLCPLPGCMHASQSLAQPSMAPIRAPSRARACGGGGGGGGGRGVWECLAVEAHHSTGRRIACDDDDTSSSRSHSTRTTQPTQATGSTRVLPYEKKRKA